MEERVRIHNTIKKKDCKALFKKKGFSQHFPPLISNLVKKSKD
jgi:hypothetical protein